MIWGTESAVDVKFSNFHSQLSHHMNET